MLENKNTFLLFPGYKGPVPETATRDGTKYPIVFQLVSTTNVFYHVGFKPSKSFSGKARQFFSKIFTLYTKFFRT